ncbi:MAG: DUF4105 domain-containing protein [Bacteroidales bacterium]|nr:DUF4105 domain-containing protein [Bacteroidales bacterium]
MKKKYIIALVFLAISSFTTLSAHKASRGITLSKNASISIITYKPGAEMYSMYGHSAIRVLDPEQGLDLVYNYGTFSFDSESFYIDFIKGKLKYHLSVSSHKAEMRGMVYEKRDVIEQVLNISDKDRQQIVDKLENTYHSDDRYYLYDFLFDNCATRIRDVVELPVKNTIYTDTSLFEAQSFRQLLQPYLKPYYWLDLGINLLLNQKTDALANLSQQMFLPDHILNIYEYTYYGNPTAEQKFIQSEEILYQAYHSDKDSLLDLLPVGWRILIAFIIITFLGYILKFNTNFLDYTIAIIYGFLSLLFISLWIISDHEVLQANWNLIWTLPVLGIFFLSQKRKLFSFYYVTINLGLLILLIAIPGIIPQSIPPVIFPFMMITGVLYIKRFIRFRSGFFFTKKT